MLGRSARRDPSNGCRGATNRRAACGNGKTPNCHRPKAAKRRSTTIRRRRTTSLPSHGRGGPQQARIAIANRNAAEDANNGFTANVNAVTSYGMSGAACGARLRASAAGGCGPHGSKSRTTATANRSPGPAAIVPPRQPYFVILSGAKNLFPCEPKAACGLCRARRRKTNEVQSRIYSGQGYRCFAALNMTVAAALRKEVNDKRSAVKNLSTYTFIQILRRSAPQNDKLLNCSQTPQQTGICNWRQRGEVERKGVRGGRGLQS